MNLLEKQYIQTTRTPLFEKPSSLMKAKDTPLQILKKLKSFYAVFIIISFVIFRFTSNVYCQDWNQMDDSTYYSLIQKRFQRNNVLISFGGSFKINYDDYKIIGFGVRPKIGYFIAKQLILSCDIDMFFSYSNNDSSSRIANYSRVLAGPSLRYYFKSKPRTIFGQFSLFGGKEKQSSKNINEFESFDRPVYGASLALGLSAFIRKFELELLAGLKISSIGIEHLQPPASFLQLNVSYIFSTK